MYTQTLPLPCKGSKYVVSNTRSAQIKHGHKDMIRKYRSGETIEREALTIASKIR